MQTIKHETHARNEQEIQDFDIEQVASGSAGATMRSPASAWWRIQYNLSHIAPIFNVDNTRLKQDPHSYL